MLVLGQFHEVEVKVRTTNNYSLEWDNIPVFAYVQVQEVAELFDMLTGHQNVWETRFRPLPQIYSGQGYFDFCQELNCDNDNL